MIFDDNYLVRIYRREPSANAGRREHDYLALIGTVENAITGVHTAFHSAEELWSALTQDGKGVPKTPKRQT